MTSMPRILIVAGSDSGGGAGIQADIKTITALGGYAMTAITAITVQNTLGVHGVHVIPPEIIAQQMQVVIEDIGVDIIKLGMLGDVATIHAIADVLEHDTHIPVILDPVMTAKGGARLLQQHALDALKARLIPRATLITPNLPEAEQLLACAITSVQHMREAAKKVHDAYGCAVLMKGGHGEGAQIVNLLHTGDGSYAMHSQRIDTPHTHGTGCTMASAIALRYGLGDDLYHACLFAQHYVHGAIVRAPHFGGGHGPLHHGWCIEQKLS